MIPTFSSEDRYLFQEVLMGRKGIDISFGSFPVHTFLICFYAFYAGILYICMEK